MLAGGEARVRLALIWQLIVLKRGISLWSDHGQWREKVEQFYSNKVSLVFAKCSRSVSMVLESLDFWRYFS